MIKDNSIREMLLVNDSWKSHAIIIKTSEDYRNILRAILDICNDLVCSLVEFVPENSLLTISDVKELQSKLRVKQTKGQLVLIKANKFPPISQTALLKTLEDIIKNTVIIILTKPEAALLDTIKSRVEVIDYDSATDLALFGEFKAMALKERLEHYDSYNESFQVGKLFHEALLYLSRKNLGQLKDCNTTKDSSMHSLQVILHTYDAWQEGSLITKYSYESLALNV